MAHLSEGNSVDLRVLVCKHFTEDELKKSVGLSILVNAEVEHGLSQPIVWSVVSTMPFELRMLS